MKKLLLSFAALICLGIVSLYVFIPNDLQINRLTTIVANKDQAFKYLNNQKTWPKWWPKKDSATPNCSNGFCFKVDSVFYSSLFLTISTPEGNTSSQIHFLPGGKDSLRLLWGCKLPTSHNPYTRFMSYLAAEKLAATMGNILANYQTFMSKNQNLYGIPIINGHIRQEDTLMIFTKKDLPTYPNTTQVYSMLQDLEKYAAQKGAQPTGLSLLNVTYLETEHIYLTQTALPINKKIPETTDIKIKQMFPGKALVAEIKGGEGTLKEAEINLAQYKTDHSHVSPAMPFQALVTNRLKESDTAKWQTVLFYPIY